MDQQFLYLLAADLMLVAHLLTVVFIVGGLVLIVIGGRLAWRWVRNPWFRSAHLVAIAVVVLQAWLGRLCPLTTWEMSLRSRAGEATYSGSFIAHWLEQLLYYQAPFWVFVVAYSVFGILVLGCWFWIRPRAFRGSG